MINYVNSNKGVALVSRRGTHVPLLEINSAEVKKLKNNCACIKIINKNGESFYADYRVNVTDKYKVQRELEESLSDLQSKILGINQVKSNVIVNDDKVWTNSATLNENSANALFVDNQYNAYCASTNIMTGTVINNPNPQNVSDNLSIIGGIDSYLI